jgi:hypothetical protein
MYNLDSHYENILHLANSIIADCKVIYLHPFGSTQPENVENIGSGNGNGPTIIVYDQEPLDCVYNSYLLDYIIDNFRDGVGNKKESFILINTEKLSKEKNKITKKYYDQGVILSDCSYFFHALCASDWYRGYRFDPRITSPSNRRLTKKFISFNRITGNSRVYRSLLVAELADVIDQGYVSYSDRCPVHNEFYVDALYRNSKKYNLDPLFINDTIDKLKSIDGYPLRIDSNDEHIPNGSYSIGPLPELMSSFLHVVTETMFWDNRTHLTEKIFKPIVAKQPFVLVGCATNLEYLKSYGFKTFDRWWDESYDGITDPIKRIEAVSKIVKYICSKSLSELEDMLSEMRETLDYNYNRFYSTEFINSVWTELSVNLKLHLLNSVIK